MRQDKRSAGTLWAGSEAAFALAHCKPHGKIGTSGQDAASAAGGGGALQAASAACTAPPTWPLAAVTASWMRTTATMVDTRMAPSSSHRNVRKRCRLPRPMALPTCRERDPRGVGGGGGRADRESVHWLNPVVGACCLLSQQQPASSCAC